MSIGTRISDDGNTLTINMPEKFDFSVHNDFRNSYQNNKAKNFVLDMSKTAYMDSAALGMLLQLREYTGDNKSAITIKNIKTNVKQILDIANFDKLLLMQ